MVTIYKYILPAHSSVVSLSMPEESTVLSIAEENNSISMWVQVDTYKSRIDKEFVIALTGSELPAKAGKFLGTVLLDGGVFVAHVFSTEKDTIEININGNPTEDDMVGFIDNINETLKS